MPNNKKDDNPLSFLPTDFEGAKSITPLKKSRGVIPEDLPANLNPEEFTEYTGENINPYTQNLELMRAEEQPVSEQAGRFLVNVGAEVAGGSLEGAGYILGLPEMAIDVINGEQANLTNAISEAGKALREGAREEFPIYQKNPGEFDMLDTGWWFNNGVSIASTLSLLIPATGAAKGVGMLGRGLKAITGLKKGAKGRALLKSLTGSKTTDTVKGLKETLNKAGVTGRTLSQAAFSRHAENLMEAAPVFEEKYEQYLEEGLSETVARQKAAEAASTIYKWNSLFLLQDIGTFGLLSKASKNMRATRMGKSLDDIPDAPSWKATLTEFGTEGAEEAYQYAVSEEAGVLADQSAGLIEPGAFSDRLSSYVNGEMMTSAFFGAAGAGVMRFVGSRLQSLLGERDATAEIRKALQQAAQEKGEPLTDDEAKKVADNTSSKILREVGQVFDNYTNASERIDEDIQELKDNGGDHSFLTGLKTFMSNIKHLEGQGTKLSIVDDILGMSEEERNQELERIGVSVQNLEDYKYVLDKMENLHKKNKVQFGKYGNGITMRQADNLYRQRINQRRQADIAAEIAEMPNYNELEPKGKKILDAEYKRRGIKQAIDTVKQADNLPNKETLLSQLQEDLSTQQAIIDAEKSKEQKGGEQKKSADNKIISANEAAIADIANSYEPIAMSNAAITANSARENQLKENYKAEQKKRKSKKKQKQPKTPEEIAAEKEKEKMEPYIADIDESITTPVDTAEDIDVGEHLTFSMKGGKTFPIIENEEGRKGFMVGDEFQDLEKVIDSGANFQLFKLSSQQEAERKAKESLPEEEVKTFDQQVPDEYSPVQAPTSGQEAIQYAAWVSINNENANSDNLRSEDIARTNWAESVESIENADGTPKYYFEFVPDQGATAQGREAIRAYVKDENGDQVIDSATDSPVFFYVTAPGTRSKVPNSDELITNVRQTIIDITSNGDTAVAPITSKSEGQWRYGNTQHSVRELLGLQKGEDPKPQLYILGDDGTYRNSKSKFRQVGLGNNEQVGRVYTVTTGLNGRPKVIPLERKKLDQPLTDTVLQIVNDIVNGAAPGDTISEQVKSKMTGHRAEGLLEVLGQSPSYKELLDTIVLEGQITRKLDTHKLFHIEFTKGKGKGVVRFGDETISFQDFRDNPDSAISRLGPFLRKREQNVLRSRLGDNSYDEYLLESNVLQQNIEIINDGQILYQPDIRYGQPMPENAEQQVTEQTQDVETPDVMYKGNPYKIAEGNKVINMKSGKELDPSSSYARAILAEAAKEDSPVIDENNKTTETRELTEEEKDQLRDQASDMFDEDMPFQRIASEVADKSLRPLLERLKSRFDIPYVLVNSPEANWNGVYDNGVVFINTARAGIDTAFHEYTHPIIRQIKQNSPILYASLTSQILSSSDGKYTYKQVKKAYPEYDSDQLVEETIVQLIGRKAELNQTTQTAIQGIWNKIVEYIKSLFNLSVNVSDIPHTSTLQDIADLVSGTDMVNVEQNPMAAYSRVDQQMTFKEANSWVNSMMYMLLRQSGVADYTDADKIDFMKLKEVMQRRLELGLPSHIERNQRRILNDLFTEKGVNKDSLWYQAINDKLNAFDIVVDDQISTDYIDDETGYEYQPAYLFDGKERAASFVRMLFSTVPKTQMVGGKLKAEINDYTGMPEFHNFNDIWNMATRTLANVTDAGDQKIFDKFIDRLSKLTELRPELKLLVSKLQKMDKWKKQKFVTAFYQAGQNYTTLYYDNRKFKIIENEPTSAERKVQQGWLEEFNKIWIEKDNKVDEQKKQRALKKYHDFAKEWSQYYKLKGDKPGAIPDKYYEGIVGLLSNLGLDIRKEALDYLAVQTGMNKKKALDHLISVEGLNRLYTGKSSLKSFKGVKSNNPVEDQQTALKFIEAEAFFRQDLGTLSVFGPANNVYYNYSNYSMMGKLLDYYKQDPDMIERVKDHKFYSGSQWLTNDIIANLTVTNNMAFRRKSQVGKKMKRLNAVDRVIIDINKTLRGQYGMLARGANATEFNIKGAPFVKSYDVDSSGNVTLNSDAVDQLMGYVYDELARSYETKSFIENMPEDRYVDGYHNKEMAGVKSFLMPKLNENTEYFDPDKQEFVRMTREEFLAEPKLRQAVQRDFKVQVEELKRFITDNGITQRRAQQLVSSDNNYDTSNDYDAKLFDYLFNGMVANVEQQKLFASDIAMFATGKGEQGVQDTIANMQKRILANGSMGVSWDTDGQIETYNSAVIKDVFYDSKVYDKYKGVNAADAQAWVTMDFYIDALKGFGKWTPDHDVALDRINSGTYMNKDISLFMQPLKTVHFERVAEDGLIRPTYDKQTIMPLIPQVIQNSSLNNLLINMQVHDVDHVTVESGKKLGRVSPTEAVDPETMKFKEEFDLNSFTQSKKFTFLQTEMPTKGVQPIPMGSQQRYNIIADLDPDFEYEGKNVIATIHNINNAIANVQLKQELTDQITTDGKLDSKKLRNKLIDLSMTGEVDRNLIDFLKQDLPLESMPNYNFELQNTIMSMVFKAGVQTKHTNGIRGIQATRVGFDKLTKQGYSDIVWLAEDEFNPPTLEGGKLKPGQMLIPHSILEEYNLDVSTASGKNKLREILSGIDYRIPNQSISNIGAMEAIGILPKYMGDTVVVYSELNEKSGSDNDGDKVELMLYNYGGKQQPEIVKYWSEEGANKEKTLREIHNYRSEVLGEAVGKEDDFVAEYLNQDILLANSKDGLGNYLLDVYKAILGSEDGFKRSTQKLESAELEKAIKSHPNYADKQPVRHFEVVSPFHQVLVRDSFLNANSGVGQISNHILDHVKSQHKEIYTTSEDGKPVTISGLDVNTIETQITDSEGNNLKAVHMDAVENVDGKRISDILSQFMNAQVDAEKDDYAPKGNFNTETNSVAMAMVRAGARLKDVVNIIGSESVRAYSKYKSMKKNTFSEYDGDPRQSALNELETDRMPADLQTFLDYEKIAIAQSTSIQQNRFSVTGGGSSFATAMAYESFRNERVIRLANTHKKFEAPDGSPSIEEQSFYNGVMYPKDMFGQDSLAFSQAFHDAIETLEANTKFEKINLITGDASATNNLYFEFYGYLMGEAFDGINQLSLITGENTLADKVRQYPEGKNALIDYLIPTKYGKFDFIQTSNKTTVDNELKNTLSEAWADLYKENPSLAKNLVVYAYYQSNFKRNLNSFFEFIPPVLHNEFGFSQAYKAVQNSTDSGFDGFVDQYIRHNASDNSLVPKVEVGQFTVQSTEDITLQENQILVTDTDVLKASTPNAKVQYVKFYNKDGILELYERVNKNIFQRTTELGLNQDGHKFYEYDMHQYPTESAFRQGSASTIIDAPIDKNYGTDLNKIDNWRETENNDQSPMEPDKPCN